MSLTCALSIYEILLKMQPIPLVKFPTNFKRKEEKPSLPFLDGYYWIVPFYGKAFQH